MKFIIMFFLYWFFLVLMGIFIFLIFVCDDDDGFFILQEYDFVIYIYGMSMVFNFEVEEVFIDFVIGVF